MSILILLSFISGFLIAMQQDPEIKANYTELKTFEPKTEATIVDCFFKKNDKGEDELVIGFNSRLCLFETFDTEKGELKHRQSFDSLFNTPGIFLQNAFYDKNYLYLLTAPFIDKCYDHQIEDTLSSYGQRIYRCDRDIWGNKAINGLLVCNYYDQHVIAFEPEEQFIIIRRIPESTCRVERSAIFGEKVVLYPKKQGEKLRDIVYHREKKLAAMIVDNVVKKKESYRTLKVASAVNWKKVWSRRENVELMAFNEEGDKLICLTNEHIYQYKSDNGLIPLTKTAFRYDNFVKEYLTIKDPKVYSIMYADNEVIAFDRRNKVSIFFDETTGSYKRMERYENFFFVPEKIVYPSELRFNEEKTLKAVIKKNKVVLYKKEK